MTQVASSNRPKFQFGTRRTECVLPGTKCLPRCQVDGLQCLSFQGIEVCDFQILARHVRRGERALQVAFLNSSMDTVSGLTMMVINRCVDLCFFTDLFINFNLSYYDPDLGAGMWVVNQRKIVLRYLTTHFFTDLFSTIPFELISMLLQSESLRKLRVVRTETARTATSFSSHRKRWGGWSGGLLRDGSLFSFTSTVNCLRCECNPAIVIRAFAGRLLLRRRENLAQAAHLHAPGCLRRLCCRQFLEAFFHNS